MSKEDSFWRTLCISQLQHHFIPLQSLLKHTESCKARLGRNCWKCDRVADLVRLHDQSMHEGQVGGNETCTNTAGIGGCDFQ